MSESPAKPLRSGVIWDISTDANGLPLPRHVTSEHREEAEALAVAAAEGSPSWYAEATLDFGSAVPPVGEVA
jgi:hypothetical protein